MKLITHALCIVLMFSSAVLDGVSQNPAPAKASDRTNGIVEAEIGNGDLKPARFAQVIAVPASLANEIRSAISSMATTFDQARTRSKSTAETNLIEVQCVTGMLQVRPAFIRLSQVAHDNSASGIIATEVDEAGEFSLMGFHDGPYVVLATGKIGMNAAVWLVDVEPAARSERVKLVRPKLACYDPQGLYKP